MMASEQAAIAQERLRSALTISARHLDMARSRYHKKAPRTMASETNPISIPILLNTLWGSRQAMAAMRIF